MILLKNSVSRKPVRRANTNSTQICDLAVELSIPHIYWHRYPLRWTSTTRGIWPAW